MNNIKKVLASLTALSCIGSMLTAFPAVAEENAFNPRTDNYLIVLGTQDDSCFMRYQFYSSPSCGGIRDAVCDADFSYGDILITDEELDINSHPIVIDDASTLKKIGTYEDFFTTKELTVTRVAWDTVYLEDSNGKKVSFVCEKDIDSLVNMENANEGDVYTFACYENDNFSTYNVVLPLQKLKSGFDWRTDDYFVVAGTNGDSTILDYYWHNGDELIHELIRSDIKGFNPGDILTTEDEFRLLETYPCQFDDTPEFQKVNIYDHLNRVKNLTVTSIENGKYFSLIDQDGNSYSYIQDFSFADYPVSMADAEIGDTYIFTFYDECLVAPVEKFNFSLDKNDYFVVIGKNMMRYGGELIRNSTISNFSYGDVLTLNEEFNILESYPCQIYNKNDFEKVGTCADFFPVRDLTLTSVKQNEYSEDYKTFYFVDSDGNEYTYSQDYYAVNYGYNLKDAQVGEVYPFYCRKQTALTPVLPTPDGDADGDDKLNILDVITVNRAILGKEKFPSTRIPYVDFNGNGIPDFDDSLLMMRMIVGLI